MICDSFFLSLRSRTLYFSRSQFDFVSFSKCTMRLHLWVWWKSSKQILCSEGGLTMMMIRKKSIQNSLNESRKINMEIINGFNHSQSSFETDILELVFRIHSFKAKVNSENYEHHFFFAPSLYLSRGSIQKLDWKSGAQKTRNFFFMSTTKLEKQKMA